MFSSTEAVAVILDICNMKYRQRHFTIFNLSRVSKYCLAHSTVTAKLDPNYDLGFSCSAKWDMDIRFFQNKNWLPKSCGLRGAEVYKYNGVQSLTTQIPQDHNIPSSETIYKSQTSKQTSLKYVFPEISNKKSWN